MTFDPSDLGLLLAHIAVLWVPGLALALAVGMRPWIAAASAPLLTYGIATVAGPFTATVGLRWGPTTLILAAVLASVLAVTFRFLPRRLRLLSGVDDPTVAPGAPGLGSDLAMAAGVLIGGVVSVAASLAGMGSFATINQDWDAVFHANTVRFILDTGDADPTALAAINDFELGSFFYPNSFHSVAAVTGELTGAGIFQLLNVPIALLGGIAGLGLAVLMRTFGARLAAAAAVPVLLAAFASFPYDVSWRGPLIPFAMGVALLPAFAVLTETTLATRRPASFLLTGLAACGLFGLHPSVAVVGAMFVVALLAARWWGHRQRIRSDLICGGILALLTVVLGIQQILGVLGTRVIDVQDWPAVTTPGRAFGDLLVLNHDSIFPQYWLVVLMLIGALGIGRIRALWWWLAVTAAFVGLFVLAAAYEGPWVAKLTGLWWNDRYRLAAIAVLGFAVLAANGVVVAADRVVALLGKSSRVARLPRRSAVAAASAVILVMFGTLSSGFYLPPNVARMSSAYQDGLPYAAGVNVTTADREAMEELARMVEPGQRVMNDPNDGSALMYALVGVQPMFGHITPNPLDKGPDRAALVLSFNCLDSDPDVRALVDEYDIGYVFQGGALLRPGMERFPGLLGLDQVDSLERVWSDETDMLGIYRIALQPLAAPSTPCAAQA